MKKYLILLFVALAAVFQSCDNHDDLWDAIDDLKSRVQALETQVDALNGNIEALQRLYGGATISKVDKTDGKYLITLTNGEIIELAQGSEAEAVIPVIGIDDNGYWQVSTDNGKTFTSLGVKAEAGDGVTPCFRIDEKTGYWQVSYDGGATFENVLDTSDKPVSAVGTGEVTDKFFEEVTAQGDELYIRLIGGGELRIPIVSDFYCRIVIPTEGVQTFDAGVTRSFGVEIKGAEQVKLSAPQGWTARMTDVVENKAQLFVTAPSAATRASADTSTDVALEAFSAKGFSTVAKIRVATTGVAPVAPTIAVKNSATVEPAQTALTFDVELSANADGWKYICLKSAETAPDAAKILADGAVGVGTSVTVGDLEANTAYTIYVVAYAGDLNSDVQRAENTTAAPVPTQTDYYQDYLDGRDITLGDLMINRTTYAEAQLLKPSQLTNAIITAGGLIFVDNSDAADLSFTISGTSINMGDIVMVGRYPERAQATINGPELRCKYNAAFKNLHVAASGNYNLFTTTNAAYDPTLQVEDCTVDATYNVVYDAHNTQNFKKVYFGNSIVKMTVANKPFYSTKAKEAHTQQLIRLNNNVFYAQTPLQNYLVNCGDKSQAFRTAQLRIEVTDNTFYNIYQPNILIRAYTLAGLDVTRNVGYYAGVTAKSYLTGVYDTTDFTADKASVTYNYLYTTPVSDSNFWSAIHTGSYTPDHNQMGEGLEVPFSSMNVAKGYFPVSPAAVTTGAGASYDTKRWFRAE